MEPFPEANSIFRFKLFHQDITQILHVLLRLKFSVSNLSLSSFNTGNHVRWNAVSLPM